MLTLVFLQLFTAADAAQALPVVSRLEDEGRTPVTIRGALSKRRARELTALARAVQADVARRFLSPADHSGAPSVELCLFETSADYQAFGSKLLDGAPAPSDLGFYEPTMRVVVAHVGPAGGSIGNLRHELAHALLADDFPDIPSWLTEGVGALYGTASLQPSGEFRFVVNYRLRHLRAAKRAGQLPELAALVSSEAAAIYGDQAPTWYALSRYLLLYLDGRGTLPGCFARLRAATSRPQQLAVLEEEVRWADFLAWTDTLTLPQAR